MIRLSHIPLAAACAAALLSWSPAGANAAGGGLSVTPAVIERTAARGATTPVTVVNGTTGPLKITVTPRPWTQSRRTGAVVPNRRKTLLSRVKLSARSFRASSLRTKGRAIVLPVRNTGNTIGPMVGDVSIKGARGTRSGTVSSKPILPGSTVDVGLSSTKGLPAGTYTVRVSLVQNGKRVLRTTRRLRVR